MCILKEDLCISAVKPPIAKHSTPPLTWPSVCGSRYGCDGPRHYTHHSHTLHCSLRVVGEALEDACMLLLHGSDHQAFICGWRVRL